MHFESSHQICLLYLQVYSQFLAMGCWYNCMGSGGCEEISHDRIVWCLNVREKIRNVLVAYAESDLIACLNSFLPPVSDLWYILGPVPAAQAGELRSEAHQSELTPRSVSPNASFLFNLAGDAYKFLESDSSHYAFTFVYLSPTQLFLRLTAFPPLPPQTESNYRWEKLTEKDEI